MSEQFGVSEASKKCPNTFGDSETMSLSKTDVKYWQGAVVRPSYIRGGKRHYVKDWSVKIQHAGRRETFPLGTPNNAAAAAKAKDIYLCLLGKDWDATRAQFKKKGSARSVVTVGEFIEAARPKFGGRLKTFDDYARAFRTIVADIFEIDGGKEKYDYRSGGRDRWLQRIHRVRLSEVTPERIQKWKIAFIRRVGNDPRRKRAARISVNSLMRQAKSLFALDLLKFVPVELQTKPFDGVKFEQRQSMRYQSGFDIKTLIEHTVHANIVTTSSQFLLSKAGRSVVEGRF
jgi:hypothetical protein